MKAFKILILFSISCFFILNSCSKDDDDSEQASEFLGNYSNWKADSFHVGNVPKGGPSAIGNTKYSFVENGSGIDVFLEDKYQFKMTNPQSSKVGYSFDILDQIVNGKLVSGRSEISDGVNSFDAGYETNDKRFFICLKTYNSLDVEDGYVIIQIW